MIEQRAGAWAAALLASLLGVTGCGAATDAAERLQLARSSRQPWVAPAAGEIRPERPHAGAADAMQWPPLLAPWSDACDGGQLRIWQAEPRIEEIRCADPSGTGVRALQRLDGAGRVRWRMEFDPREPDARVAGIDDRGVLLDTLWRIAIEDGRREDLAPAALARRSLRLGGPLAAGSAFVYAAQAPTGTLARGAILRLDRASGRQEAVATLPRRGLLSRWQAEDLALSADGRWLFVALQEDWRGPAAVAIAVLDLERREWRALRVQCEDGNCGAPRVLRADVAWHFAYRDLGQAEVVLERYDWAQR